jgi:proteasome lid subunit RPN8/RPN11
VTSPAPAQLCTDLHLLTVLRAWFRAAEPDEGCALLIGRREGGVWQLRSLWPCRNVWPRVAARRRRFAIDPREQLLAQKWARNQGLELLGAAHSHPASAAVPSAMDRRLCLRPALMVIAGVGGDCRAWWLAEESLQPRLVPWRMDP